MPNIPIVRPKGMKKIRKNNGSVMLITIFVISMLSVLVAGMLQMNTEEIQLMQNQINAAESMAIAEAGLNEAMAQLRTNSSWASGFINKSFAGGSYTVDVTGSLPNLTLTSTATSARGFVCKVQADVTVSESSPYIIRIDNLRVNESSS